jgi:hypothetical protein
MVKIDKKTHKIYESNFHEIETNKDLIIIGDTSRKKSNHIVRMKYRDYGLSTEWNTFTISRDGVIYQHYDPKYYSDFIGDKLLDKRSISVLFENMGYIYHSDGKYYNWINEECENIQDLYRKHWKIGYFWEKYTEKQYKSFVDLSLYLFDKFNIPKNIIATNLYEENSYDYQGIISRSNLYKEDVDVNPSFNYDKIIQMISEKTTINQD